VVGLSAVVRTWQTISMRTIFTENAPGPVGVLYVGFTSLAMYRAAQVTGHLRGAAEAAVATAAHDVLVEYHRTDVLDSRRDRARRLLRPDLGWAALPDRDGRRVRHRPHRGGQGPAPASLTVEGLGW